jgi:hypothetical protein
MACAWCQSNYNIVMCIPIARQRLSKHIPTQTNLLNNRISIAGQQISKYASLTTEVVLSVLSVQSNYEEVFGIRQQ